MHNFYIIEPGSYDKIMDSFNLFMSHNLASFHKKGSTFSLYV